MNEITKIDTGVLVSESAARRINALSARQEAPVKLRVMVLGGGCQGYKYKFDFVDAVNGDDKIFARDGAEVIIDDVSMDLLVGAEVNYVESLMGAYFEIRNPNASSTCGCGTSFAAK